MAMKTMFMFLIIVVMATSLTEAQNPIGIIHVNGTLYCSSNGSLAGKSNTPPAFSGATLQVACTADVVFAPPNVTTNSNGVYLVVLVPRPNATVNSIVSSCRLSVLTPLSACNPALPPAGLVSNLKFVKTVPNGFWFTTFLVASGFTLQT